MPENTPLQPANTAKPNSIATRRALMKSAAWSVPVIAVAVAAPAQAASTTARCTATTNYTAMTTGTKPSSVAFVNSKPATTMKLDYVGSDDWRSSDATGTVQDGPEGGIDKKWIKFENYREGSWGPWRDRKKGLPFGSALTVTLSFSRPVSDLRFTLFDLDWVEGGYRDAVKFITEPTSSTTGSGLEGDGTPERPWQKREPGEISSKSLNGNIDLFYKGPIQTVSFVYFQNSESIGATKNQLIGLSDVRFDDCR